MFSDWECEFLRSIRSIKNYSLYGRISNWNTRVTALSVWNSVFWNRSSESFWINRIFSRTHGNWCQLAQQQNSKSVHWQLPHLTFSTVFFLQKYIRLLFKKRTILSKILVLRIAQKTQRNVKFTFFVVLSDLFKFWNGTEVWRMGFGMTWTL